MKHTHACVACYVLLRSRKFWKFGPSKTEFDNISGDLLTSNSPVYRYIHNAIKSLNLLKLLHWCSYELSVITYHPGIDIYKLATHLVLQLVLHFSGTPGQVWILYFLIFHSGCLLPPTNWEKYYILLFIMYITCTVTWPCYNIDITPIAIYRLNSYSAWRICLWSYDDGFYYM